MTSLTDTNTTSNYWQTVYNFRITTQPHPERNGGSVLRLHPRKGNSAQDASAVTDIEIRQF
jgi:hypothetical protein